MMAALVVRARLLWPLGGGSIDHSIDQLTHDRPIDRQFPDGNAWPKNAEPESERPTSLFVLPKVELPKVELPEFKVPEALREFELPAAPSSPFHVDRDGDGNGLR